MNVLFFKPEFDGLFCENVSYNTNSDNSGFNLYESNLNATYLTTSTLRLHSEEHEKVDNVSSIVTSTLIHEFQSVTSPPVIYLQKYPSVEDVIPKIQNKNYEFIVTSTLAPSAPFNKFEANPSQDLDVKSIKSSICDFEPCLNYGNCVPIINSNSLFKFRCICPESYAGILCENYFPLNQAFNSYDIEREPLILDHNSQSSQDKLFWMSELTASQTPEKSSTTIFNPTSVTTETTSTTTVRTTTESLTLTDPATQTFNQKPETKNRKFSVRIF